MFRIKNPKDKEINLAKTLSRIKILIGGGLMSIAVILAQVSFELTSIFALASAGMFFWDIYSQTQSGIKLENRISDLEKEIEKLKNNSKSENQPPSELS